MNTITFMTGLLTFYIKGEISVEQNFLKLKLPNVILTFIPFGAEKHNIPVNQISSVASNFKLNIKELLFGILELVLALICFVSLDAFCIFLGIVLLILSASAILRGIIVVLEVDSTAGATYIVPFLVFEKNKAFQAERIINDIVTDRLNDTNSRQVVENQTNILVDALNKR